MITITTPNPSGKAGQLHLLVDDLHVRVIDAATGELLRQLTIDTTRDYQPTGAPKGPTRPKRNAPNPTEGSKRFPSPER
jgi:hypothetical protein